jgi:hypothetical protein
MALADHQNALEPARPDALKPIPLRQNALDSGFHGVPNGPAHPDREAEGAGVA